MQLHKVISTVFLIVWLSETKAPGTVVFNPLNTELNPVCQ